MANDGTATPISDLFEQLIASHDVPDNVRDIVRDKILAMVRPVEAALTAAYEKAATPQMVEKEYERRRKSEYRSRRSKNVPDMSRTTPTIYNSSNTNTLSKKKVFKEESKKVSGGKNLHRGHALPNDWKPKEAHYEQGVKLGFDRQTIDGFAERMRNWAEANQHRQVARKSNWDAAFRNWVSGAAERNGGGHNGKVTAHHGAFGFDELAARLERGQGNGAGDSLRHAAGHEHGSGCYDSEERVERLAGSGQTSLFASRSHR